MHISTRRFWTVQLPELLCFLASNELSSPLNLVTTQNLSSPQYYRAEHIPSSEQQCQIAKITNPMEMYKRNYVVIKCQGCQVPLYVCPSNNPEDQGMGSTKNNLPQISVWFSSASSSSRVVSFTGNRGWWKWGGQGATGALLLQTKSLKSFWAPVMGLEKSMESPSYRLLAPSPSWRCSD